MFIRFAELSSFFSYKTEKRFWHLMFLPMSGSQFASTHKRTGSGIKVRKKIKIADHATTVRRGPSITCGCSTFG